MGTNLDLHGQSTVILPPILEFDFWRLGNQDFSIIKTTTNYVILRPNVHCPVPCDYSVSFLGLCLDLGREGFGLELGLDNILEGHIHIIFILIVTTEKYLQKGPTLCTFPKRFKTEG